MSEESATILMLLKRVDCVDGVSAYLETIIAGLRELGDRVVLVTGPVSTTDGSEMRRRAIEAAAQDWVVVPDFAAMRPSVALVRQIMAIMRSRGVNVISPQGFAVLPLGRLLGLLTGCPVVSNYHPSLHGNETAKMTGRRSFKERLAYRAASTMFRADCFIALSHDIALFFRDICRIPQARIHEQVLGVETDFYRRPTEAERRRAREKFGLDDNALIAVLPGRMDLSKGHDVAAAAVRILRKHRPEMPVVCLFPGGGDQRARIEADTIRDGADRQAFRFLGFVDRGTMRDAYWAADIVLLPSRMEGFGLVVAEAMCCGAIVIRTPSGGWQDQVIEGVTGHIVPFNDPEALAAAIEAVADSPSRAAMREAAIEHASTKFAKQRMVDGTSRLYRAMMMRPPPKSPEDNRR